MKRDAEDGDKSKGKGRGGKGRGRGGRGGKGRGKANVKVRMTPTPKKRERSPGIDADDSEKVKRVAKPPKRTKVAPEPSATSAEPKKKAKKTEQPTKPPVTKVEKAKKKAKKGGEPDAVATSEVAVPPRIKDPTLNLTKTFARRKRPNSDAGVLKWETLRVVFNEYIKPQLASYSVHEDGGEEGRIPGMIEVKKYIARIS